MDAYEYLLARTGEEAQLRKLREECEELKLAIDAGLRAEIAEEMADVAIVLQALQPFFGAATRAARLWKERRMEAFWNSRFRSWEEWKAAGYPGFDGDKAELLARLRELVEGKR